jgi:L-aminopeptidase/D-esterase-like protein
LANGGNKHWGEDPPYRRLGQAAFAAAGRRFALGATGAGRGAMAGTLPGGLGSASIDLGDGLVVGALVAANPIGSVFMPDGHTFWSWPFEIDGEFGGRRPAPDASPAIEPLPEHCRLAELGRTQAGANTTLAVVACSADLDSVECHRVAMMAHDGMARAVRPAHTPFDGDTVFALAAGRFAAGTGNARHVQIGRIGSAAADCLARAIARGVHANRGAP